MRVGASGKGEGEGATCQGKSDNLCFAALIIHGKGPRGYRPHWPPTIRDQEKTDSLSGLYC